MRTVIALLVLLAPAVLAQDEQENQHEYDSGESKIPNYWTFNVQISSEGFVIGGARHFKVAPFTHLSVAGDIFWVRGKDEQVDVFGNTINGESIMILPLTVSLKRRLLGETLSNTFRPFVTVGGGGVFGWYIGGDLKRSQLASDHKDTQFALTGVAGVGADFGRPGSSAYGFDIKYQIIRFPNHLGLRKNFDNLQIGFHVNF